MANSNSNVRDTRLGTTTGRVVGVSGDRSSLTYKTGTVDVGNNSKLNTGNQFDNVKGNITINDSGAATATSLLDKLKDFIPAAPAPANAGTSVVTPPSPTPGPSVSTDASGSPATTKTPADSVSSDATAGTKAGIGIGVVIFLVVVGWFLFFRKKKS